MPQSLAKVNIHIVFSTKIGRRLINDEEIRKELHSFIIGVISNLGMYTHELHANPDHIHILCTLSRTITMAELIGKVKSSSSKWLKQRGIADFDWQDGYSVFSVDAKGVEKVKAYIRNQPVHHKSRHYKQEIISYFDEYGIPYDPRYVWD
jgi:REP element-mobilizing transposase RayT